MSDKPLWAELVSLSLLFLFVGGCVGGCAEAPPTLPPTVSVSTSESGDEVWAEVNYRNHPFDFNVELNTLEEVRAYKSQVAAMVKTLKETESKMK